MILKELSRNVFHCSVIKVHFLSCCLTDSFDILSCCFRLVKNFFQLFLTFFKSLWKCFFLFLSFYVFLRRNSDIISSVFWIVNNFFKVFWFFYNFQLSRNSWFLAVFRQLSKTALTEYHDTPALSTLIFSFLYIVSVLLVTEWTNIIYLRGCWEN